MLGPEPGLWGAGPSRCLGEWPTTGGEGRFSITVLFGVTNERGEAVDEIHIAAPMNVAMRVRPAGQPGVDTPVDDARLAIRLQDQQPFDVAI